MAIKPSDKGTLTFSPIRGRHYLVANGNTVTREIFYDANEPGPTFPISPLIPGFERIFRFPFSWKTLMTEQQAQQRGLIPLITYQRNMKGAGETSDDAVATQKMCIVDRDIKDQHYLLDREVHPIEIDIASVDGTDVKLIFTYTIQILDMNLLLAKFPSGKFLNYAEKSIIAKLRVALPVKKFDEIRGVASSPNSNDVIGLQDDLETIKDDLNKQEFADEYGFQFLKIMHEDWIITEAAQKRLKAIQDAEVAKEEKKTTITKAEADAEAERTKGKAAADVIEFKGKAEIKVAKIRTTETGNAETEVIKKRVQEVGDKEIDILTKKIAAITPLQKLINTNNATVSGNLKELKGTLITDKSTFGGGNTLIEMLLANSIQDQKKSTDDDNQ